jgi:hypothetical protein
MGRLQPAIQMDLDGVRSLYRFLIFKYSDFNNNLGMDKFHQELFEVLTRCRNVNERESKAASMTIGTNKARLINEFIFNKHE